jgi:hypothetical protein
MTSRKKAQLKFVGLRMGVPFYLSISARLLLHRRIPSFSSAFASLGLFICTANHFRFSIEAVGRRDRMLRSGDIRATITKSLAVILYGGPGDEPGIYAAGLTRALEQRQRSRSLPAWRKKRIAIDGAKRAIRMASYRLAVTFLMIVAESRTTRSFS